MNKIDYKKNIKKVWRVISNIGSDSDTDWKIVFFLFIFSLLFTFIFHINLYLNMHNSKFSGTTRVADGEQVVDAKVLEATLSSYDKRAEEYQRIASTTFTFVDPAR